MRSRLAGTLLLLALWVLTSQSNVNAQPPLSPYAPSGMPAYTPAWAMPQGPGGMPGGGMPGMPGGGMPGGMPGMPGGMPGMGGMPGGMPGGPMAQQAAFQEGGYAPEGMAAGACDGNCGDGCGCGPGGMGGGGEYGGGGGGRRRRIFGGGARRGNAGGLYGDAIGFRWLRFFLPDDDGGACAPRWFDIGADFVYFTRDMRAQDLVVSELGFNQGIPALSMRDLSFNDSAGFRFYANIQIGAASSLEFAYLGPLTNKAFAAAADPQARLTSIVSNFANFPPGQGFAETDFGTLNTLAYSSELDSFELSHRTRWVAPECRYQGSWLIGARYIRLDEDLLYQTFTPRGRMDYLTNTNNSLTGLQLGGDLWITPLAGLRVGAEAKMGVYGNHMNAGSTVATSSTAPFDSNITSGHVAFVGELDLQMTYRIDYHWTLRLGYNFLWIDGVALAPDNFNPALPVPPFPAVPGNPYTAFIDRGGDALFHGLNVGLEYLW